MHRHGEAVIDREGDGCPSGRESDVLVVGRLEGVEDHEDGVVDGTKVRLPLPGVEFCCCSRLEQVVEVCDLRPPSSDERLVGLDRDLDEAPVPDLCCGGGDRLGPQGLQGDRVGVEGGDRTEEDGERRQVDERSFFQPSEQDVEEVGVQRRGIGDGDHGLTRDYGLGPTAYRQVGEQVLDGGHGSVGADEVLVEVGVDDEGSERRAAGAAEPDGLGHGRQVVGAGIEVVGADDEALATEVAEEVEGLVDAGGWKVDDRPVGGGSEFVGEREVSMVEDVPIDVGAFGLAPGLRIGGDER